MNPVLDALLVIVAGIGVFQVVRWMMSGLVHGISKLWNRGHRLIVIEQQLALIADQLNQIHQQIAQKP